MKNKFRLLHAFAVVVTIFGLSCNSETNSNRAKDEVKVVQAAEEPKETIKEQEGQDRSVVLGEKWDNVENGSAYDKAYVELGNYTKVVLPENASVRQDGEDKKMLIYMEKTLGFVGHPPEAMSIKQARKNMGCAVQADKKALVVATFGEWDSHIEGGAYMSLLFVVPKNTEIEKRPKLSGEDSIGREWNGAYLTKPAEVKEGYWYGPASPSEGWKAVPSIPDPGGVQGGGSGWIIFGSPDLSLFVRRREPWPYNTNGITALLRLGATTMGRVMIPVVIENQYDLYEVSQGRRKPEEVRRLEIPEGLVDTGAKMLSLPKRMIEALGLQFLQERQVITTAGPANSATYGLVRLSLLGRQAPLDVAALPDECPVRIGYIPLEQLDLVVDPTGQRLMGDPFHKGENLIDMY